VAEEKKETKDAKDAGAKGGGMMKIVMIAVVVVLVAGGAGGGFIMGQRGKAKPAEETAAVTAEDNVVADATASHGEAAEEAAPAEGGHGGGEGGGAAAPAESKKTAKDLTFSFDRNFTTNLMDGNGRLFVQTTIQLEATDEKTLTQIEENVAPLRDAILFLLGSKQSDEVRTPAGKERLKREMLARFDGILEPNAVKNVYITDLMVVRQ
jgi:flagellar basal body-associated protein FliL